MKDTELLITKAHIKKYKKYLATAQARIVNFSTVGSGRIQFVKRKRVKITIYNREESSVWFLKMKNILVEI